MSSPWTNNAGGGGIDQAAVAITGGSITGVSGVQYILAERAIPFIHVSSGSIGNNGALSGITALAKTYSGGAWVYYPANAIVAGSSAGWYWTVFSSTTAGTIYNSVYTSGVPGLGTQTAFATTGPGAFTGDTTERAGPTITVPAAAMGLHGALRVAGVYANNNSGNNKTMRIRFGGAAGTTYLANNATTALSSQVNAFIQNTGAANSQTGFGLQFNQAGSVAYGAASSTIDTASAAVAVISLQKANAADNQVLEQYSFVLSNGG